MPELPEVETTRRGIEPHVVGRRITKLHVHDRRLRWPVDLAMVAAVAGRAIRRAGRRAKYLLLETEAGTLILHLGMSGSLRVLPVATPRIAHDHVDIELDSGVTLRFNDPRRFGSLLFTAEDPAGHPLLRSLAPEPLEDDFDGEYLWKITRRRQVAIKQLIMNSRLVVGVGNIYASEALFRARAPATPGAFVESRRMREARTGHQGDAGHGGEGGRHDVARLCRRGRQSGLLSPEALRLRTRRLAVPRLRQARQTVHAGPTLDLLVHELPEIDDHCMYDAASAAFSGVAAGLKH